MADRNGKKPDLQGYVEVRDRVKAFYERHPEGIIRTRLTEDGRPFRIVKIQGEFSDPRSGELVQRTSEETYVCVVAEARRAPGEDWFTASSMEQFPGRTPYTRNSELENAETSAWGRVLAAMGIGTDKSQAPPLVGGASSRFWLRRFCSRLNTVLAFRQRAHVGVPAAR